MRTLDYIDEDIEEFHGRPPDWMLEAVGLNPAYCSWGPYEDYMWVEDDGWNGRQILETWADFGDNFGLNDLNECVNFYFEVERDGTPGKRVKTVGLRLGLVLWWLHPRKGASRGIHITNISREELPLALAFLAHAADRNACRFAKVVAAAQRAP